VKERISISISISNIPVQTELDFSENHHVSSKRVGNFLFTKR